MPSRTTVLPLAFGLSAMLLVPASHAGETPAAQRPPVRVYTNEDLERVHSVADETGVRSVPAVSSTERLPLSSRETERPRARGEAYWREEARRVRERVADLAAKADELRARIAADEEERRRSPRSGRSSQSRGSLWGGPDPTTTARLKALALRIRALEDDLEERARRDGALPGWLR